MNMTSKRLLSEKEKKKLDVPVHHEAFEFLFEKVIEERCDEFERDLEFQGFEIAHREYIAIATSIFDFKLTVSREK